MVRGASLAAISEIIFGSSEHSFNDVAGASKTLVIDYDGILLIVPWKTTLRTINADRLV